MGLPDLSRFKFESQDRTKSNSQKVRKGTRTSTIRTRYPGYAKTNSWLGPLPPILRTGLSIVFVGFNPGLKSAIDGHHYAHHSNKFYKFLHWSHLTAVLFKPEQDVDFPELFNYGFTDLVPRATRSIKELSQEELEEAVYDLSARIKKYNPLIVCFVGKTIWMTFAKCLKWDKKKFEYGHDEIHRIGESHICVVPSSSGLNTLNSDDQLKAWKKVYEYAKESGAIPLHRKGD